MSFFSFSDVLQYRQAYTGNNPSQVQTAMDGFEDVIRRFPKCAEGYALYAQVHNQKHDFLFTQQWVLSYSSLCPFYNMLAVKHLSIIQTENSSYRSCWCVQHNTTICVFFRLWLISSSLEKQTRCMTSVLNWNQTMLPHMSTRGKYFLLLLGPNVKITCDSYM